jgi:hypothetical protein
VESAGRGRQALHHVREELQGRVCQAAAIAEAFTNLCVIVSLCECFP